MGGVLPASPSPQARYKNYTFIEFKTLLNVPPEKRLLTLIPIGVPVEWPTQEKKSLAEVIHWEKYRYKFM